MNRRNNISIKHSGVFLFLFLISFPGLAQNPNREYQEYEVASGVVILTTSDGQYRFQPYTKDIFETTFIPGGEEYNPVSHAVVLEPREMRMDVSENDSSVVIDTDGIDVTITKQPFTVRYYYNEKEVISEKTGYSEGEEHQKLDFNILEDEMLFGGGARALGMNRRGNRLELYNRAHYGYETTSSLLNYTLPIVYSSNKYLLHFDNAPIGFLDLDSEANNTLTYETISGRKTYQLIVGETWEEIVGNYTLLTGRQPMPPRWALGNFSSRFGYHSQQEVMETIAKFKEENIPVDAVVLDLFWFGKEIQGTMGNLAFHRDSFPDPDKMISRLANQGVKTILVTEPFILTTSNRWEEAVKEGVLALDKNGKPHTFDFYFGNTGIIDLFKPEARDWFWNIYKGLAARGVAGWWGDLGEPEMHPEELMHATGSANEVHNIYGHSWARLIYEGYRNDFPNTRPFILMRAGAAGSQRFGMIPWSGDVNRTWGGLQSQSEIALQMGMQGLAYMHSDLGGFAGDNLDDELYVRWLQYGVFQPIYRPHAQEEVPAEPVFREARARELAKQAIQLRYRLLPYNYTLSHQNSTTGIPLMRPLFFEEPDNKDLYTVANTYLWGKDFLVSPVLTSNETTKDIYFPGTGTWYDFYSARQFKGGTTASVPVKEERIPTFVRGGAFIPMAAPMQTTAEYTASNLEVHFYPDPAVRESRGELYHDDGDTPNAIEKGAYEIINFTSKNEGNTISIQVFKEEGAQSPSQIEELRLIVHNLRRPVQFVWVNGIKYTGKNYMHQEKLNIPVRFEHEETSIRIEF